MYIYFVYINTSIRTAICLNTMTIAKVMACRYSTQKLGEIGWPVKQVTADEYNMMLLTDNHMHLPHQNLCVNKCQQCVMYEWALNMAPYTIYTFICIYL